MHSLDAEFSISINIKIRSPIVISSNVNTKLKRLDSSNVMVKLFFARRSLNESEVLSTNTFNPLIVQQSAEKFEMNLGV